MVNTVILKNPEFFILHSAHNPLGSCRCLDSLAECSMTCRSLVVRLCLLFWLLLSLTCAEDRTANTTYLRPTASAILDFEHYRLRRRSNAQVPSAAPEQVHQSLALAPGAVTISWVTHSQVRARASGIASAALPDINFAVQRVTYACRVQLWSGSVACAFRCASAKATITAQSLPGCRTTSRT